MDVYYWVKLKVEVICCKIVDIEFVNLFLKVSFRNVF